MKQISIKIAACILAIGLCGCEDMFEKEVPPHNLVGDNAITNESSAETALNGVYSYLDGNGPFDAKYIVYDEYRAGLLTGGHNMTEDEISAIKEEVPQFSNFLITEATKSTHLEDGSLVMYTIRGELETEDDFYLIEARILYNDNFVFLGRTNYRDFEMTQTIGVTKVSSKYVGKDSDDIYQYLLLSENGNTTVYWSLDSYEGLFDEWLEITFA